MIRTLTQFLIRFTADVDADCVGVAHDEVSALAFLPCVERSTGCGHQDQYLTHVGLATLCCVINRNLLPCRSLTRRVAGHVHSVRAVSVDHHRVSFFSHVVDSF
jgi:hypothetical protein